MGTWALQSWTHSSYGFGWLWVLSPVVGVRSACTVHLKEESVVCGITKYSVTATCCSCTSLKSALPHTRHQSWLILDCAFSLVLDSVWLNDFTFCDFGQVWCVKLMYCCSSIHLVVHSQVEPGWLLLELTWAKVLQICKWLWLTQPVMLSTAMCHLRGAWYFVVCFLVDFILKHCLTVVLINCGPC